MRWRLDDPEKIVSQGKVEPMRAFAFAMNYLLHLNATRRLCACVGVWIYVGDRRHINTTIKSRSTARLG